MSDKKIHQGGCACGENRYETSGNPERARVCHCRYCQLRSGSPFGVGAWFKDENIKHLSKIIININLLPKVATVLKRIFVKSVGQVFFGQYQRLL